MTVVDNSFIVSNVHHKILKRWETSGFLTQLEVSTCNGCMCSVLMTVYPPSLKSTPKLT